jgi:hypothetical protein
MVDALQFGRNVRKPQWEALGGKVRARGMADLLLLPSIECRDCLNFALPERIWIECKRPKCGQTPDQKLFQAEVEAEGHRYIVANDFEQVKEALGL